MHTRAPNFPTLALINHVILHNSKDDEIYVMIDMWDISEVDMVDIWEVKRIPVHIRCVYGDSSKLCVGVERLQGQYVQWWIDKLDTSVMKIYVNCKETLQNFNVSILKNNSD